MAKRMDPIVKKETEYVAIWVMAGCILMLGVCLVLHLWSIPVLLAVCWVAPPPWATSY